MPGRSDDRLPAQHILLTGGTGSGKTTWVKNCREIANAPRVLLWDPDRSHRARHFSNRRAYLKHVRAALASGLKVRAAYVPPGDSTEEEFHWWCSVVWAACCASRPMVAIVEELHEVTNAGKARGMWKTLLNRSRKYGVQIVAISQRPQEIDKTTLTQCSTKVTGILDRDADRVVMAKELSVSPDRIFNLRSTGKPELRYLVLRPGDVAKEQKINPVRPGKFSLS